MSEKFRQMGGEVYVEADAVKESNKVVNIAPHLTRDEWPISIFVDSVLSFAAIKGNYSPTHDAPSASV